MELWKWRRPHDPLAKYSTGDVDGYSCVRRGIRAARFPRRYNFTSPSNVVWINFPSDADTFCFSATSARKYLPPANKTYRFSWRRRVSTVNIQHQKKKTTHTLVAYEHAQNTPLCVFIMLPVWEFVYMFMAILFFSAGILLARALPGWRFMCECAFFFFMAFSPCVCVLTHTYFMPECLRWWMHPRGQLHSA